MKSLEIPSLFEVTTAAALFKELIELNKDKRGFSQRGLSGRLKWPTSYIPDVIKGRKKFSITRAVQLARYLDFDFMDMEKIILLAVADMGYTTPVENIQIGRNKSSKRFRPTEDTDLLDANVFLVFEVVKWFKGHATLEDINELTSRQGLDSEDVVRALRVLVKKEVINQKKQLFVAKNITLVSDDGHQSAQIKEVHIQFARYFIKFMENIVGPAVYNSGIVHVRRDRFEEIADKMVAMRNWIYEISAKDQTLPPTQDVRLFQIDLNLTPIASKETSHRLAARRAGNKR